MIEILRNAMAFNQSAFLKQLSDLTQSHVFKDSGQLDVNFIAKLQQNKRDIQLLGAPEQLIVQRFTGLEFLSSSLARLDMHDTYYQFGHFGNPPGDAQYNTPYHNTAPFIDEFNVDFLCPKTALNASDWLGKMLELRWTGSALSKQGYSAASQSRYLMVHSLQHLYHDGGLGTYRLRLVVPWFKLTQRLNSRIFADQNSISIAQTILEEHGIQFVQHVQTAPATRRRTTQYQCSDWDFLLFVLAEDGLSLLAQHQDGQASLVIADSDSLKQRSLDHAQNLGNIRYGTISAALHDDRLENLMIRHHTMPEQVQRSFWSSRDVKGQTFVSQPAPSEHSLLLNTEHQLAKGSIDDDATGVISGDQGFTGDPQITQQANLIQQHRLLHVTQVLAVGGVRDFKPNSRFTLSDHPSLSGQSFQVLSVRHEAANSTGYLSHITDAELDMQRLNGGEQYRQLYKTHLDTINGIEAGSYRSWVTLVSTARVVVPALRPRPQLPTMTGIVQNLAGQDDLLPDTDRDHRIHVQLPIFKSANTQHDQAQHDGVDQWIAVAEYQAGPNFGTLFSPTPNDEVLVGSQGHADALIVMGGLANTQNPLPFKPQDNQQLQSGYIAKGNASDTLQWVFNDDPKQPFQQLHVNSASKESGDILTSLTLGQVNAQGLQGVELVTSHQGVVRSGQALWVSTLPATAKDDRQHEARPLYEQLQGSMQQAQAMIDLTANLAELPTDTEVVKQLTETLKPLADKQQGDDAASLDGIPTHLEQPQLILESAADTIITGGEGILLHSGESTELWAMADITAVANESIQAASVEALAMLANQNTSVIAGSGEVKLAAHTGAMQLLASKDVNVSSSESSIKIMAKDKVIITAGGASIELSGSDITISASKFTVKAGQSSYGAGGGGGAQLEALPKPTEDNKKKKSITEIYWSYGDNFTRLDNNSRHYVDLNLHVKTENYEAGESVSVKVKYSDNDNLWDGQTELVLTGSVDESGQITFKEVFKENTLNLK